MISHLIPYKSKTKGAEKLKIELNWKIVLALFLLLFSTFITTSKILENPEIVMSVDNGTIEFEKNTKIYFFGDVLLISISSIFLGLSLMYLFNLSLDLEIKNTGTHLFNATEEKWGSIIKTLTGEEKEMYQIIYNAKGEILQKDIVIHNFSRAKVTRLLDNLEKRGLIERKRYGMTNKVVLK